MGPGLHEGRQHHHVASFSTVLCFCNRANDPGPVIPWSHSRAEDWVGSMGKKQMADVSVGTAQIQALQPITKWPDICAQGLRGGSGGAPETKERHAALTRPHSRRKHGRLLRLRGPDGVAAACPLQLWPRRAQQLLRRPCYCTGDRASPMTPPTWPPAAVARGPRGWGGSSGALPRHPQHSPDRGSTLHTEGIELSLMYT